MPQPRVHPPPGNDLATVFPRLTGALTIFTVSVHLAEDTATAIFMSNAHNLHETLKQFDLGTGREGDYYSLPALEKAGVGPISKLPVSIRIVLESVLRNCDGKRVSEAAVHALANWKSTETRTEEIPFVVARIVLQDFTGVPLLVDLAAMRSAVAKLGKNPKIIEPLVPVDLVVDHSVQWTLPAARIPCSRTWSWNSPAIASVINF